VWEVCNRHVVHANNAISGMPNRGTSHKFAFTFVFPLHALKTWLQYASNGVRFVEIEAVFLGEMLVGS